LRVMSKGRVPLTAQPPTVRKIRPGECWHKPYFPSDGEPQSALVREQFVHFQALYENGASLWEDAAGPQISFGPIKFAISSIDDVQVANEVLFYNEYNFHCNGPSIFIDVGMNAGLTSIQAAYKPDVTAVYSFEPFEDPCRRAALNFTNNPSVAGKIHPRQFGLSDENKKLQVNVATDTTIGTSILGRETGTLVTIEIRDAAEVLNNTIREAKKRGENVVMKIDCEGSEFAIMKRLEAADLLRDIDIFMLEWHKWWKVDFDQSTLLQPLLGAGFKVFDRTMPSNPWAGMLYAVRS
jgi:FkbM family methyltransferase